MQKHTQHPTAIIDEDVLIGNGSKVWHWSHISSGARIGENCSLGQNVYIGRNVKVGDNVKIQNNVSVYENVTLEDDVFCGPSMVFTNVLNPRSEIPRKNEYLNTLVKKGSTIGANATIVCGVTLGEFCFIGAGSVITKDVKPFALIIGNPGRHVGWMSRFGERIPLPIEGSGTYHCSRLNKSYVLNDDLLKEE